MSLVIMRLLLVFLDYLFSASTEKPGGRDSVVIDSLFIVAPIVCWDSVFGLCLLFSTLCPSSFAIILNGKRERAGCFVSTVFLMSCEIQCYVALPHVAVFCGV